MVLKSKEIITKVTIITSGDTSMTESLQLNLQNIIIG